MTNTGISSAIKMAKSEMGARSDPKDPECLVLSPTVKGTFRLSSLQLLIYFNLGLILILVRERQDVFTFYINKASKSSPRRPNQPRGSLRVRPGGWLSPGKAEGTAGERQEPREQPPRRDHSPPMQNKLSSFPLGAAAHARVLLLWATTPLTQRAEDLQRAKRETG